MYVQRDGHKTRLNLVRYFSLTTNTIESLIKRIILFLKISRLSELRIDKFRLFYSIIKDDKKCFAKKCVSAEKSDIAGIPFSIR